MIRILFSSTYEAQLPSYLIISSSFSTPPIRRLKYQIMWLSGFHEYQIFDIHTCCHLKRLESCQTLYERSHRSALWNSDSHHTLLLLSDSLLLRNSCEWSLLQHRKDLSLLNVCGTLGGGYFHTTDTSC